jgi:filamentous hemagglutinin family protein
MATVAQAQIASDSSLSTTVHTSDGLNFTVEQGNRAGNNLFHSFNQFSVPTNGSVYFNNALDLQNIFSRVTGGNASVIDGLIKANGTANLFLLNPSGIQFGSGARLQLGGSFFASTAESVKFSDNTEFKATNSNTPLLTVNMPVGLQFGQTPAPIQVTGPGHGITGSLFLPSDRSSSPSQLEVNSGKTLALVGGNFSANGGVFTAEEGRVELGAIGSSAGHPIVGLTPTATGGYSLNYSGVSKFGDLNLDHKSLADASGSPGGSIQVVGRNVTFTDGSLLLVQNLSSQAAGDIDILASEAFRASGANPDTLSFGVGSGAVNETLGLGASGDISVSTQQLELLSGGALYTKTYSSARGGNIDVNAPTSLDIVGFGQGPITFSVINTLSFASGQGGNINVSTGDLKIDQGGGLNAGNIGPGSGGKVTVNADVINIIGARPSSSSDSNIGASNIGSGQGGDIVVNARQITVRDGAQLSADNSGVGAAGTILINASEFVKVEGGIPGSFRKSNINASTLLVNEELREAFGLPDIPIGNSGTVTINTPLLLLSNDGAVRVRNEGIGDAGSLSINAGLIVMDNGGNIDASSPVGNGGSIDIRAGGIFSDHGGYISADAGTEGHAGDIEIDSLAVVLNHGSRISASATGSGDGGTIDINTALLAGFNNSDIVALAQQGQNGSIHLSVPFVLGLKSRSQLTSGSDIPPVPTRSYRYTPDRAQAGSSQLTEATSWHVNGQGQVQLIYNHPNP